MRRDYQYSIDELLSAARGRWQELLADAGLSVELLDGRGHPCPLCGGHDRFAALPDVAVRGAVHCRHCFTKGTDPKPGDGLSTLRWLMGIETADACRWLASWLGMTSVSPDARPRCRVRRSLPKAATHQDDRSIAELAERCHAAMLASWWFRLSALLNLPADELRRLRVGWSARHRATTWPMFNHDGNVVGIRLRSMETGDKWSVPGGRAGLFVPDSLREHPDRLFICEGPTDTAALLSSGLDAVGRPSCHGAVAMTTKLVKRLCPAESIIVADDDDNGAGMRGAESLSTALVTVCPAVRIITPPPGVNDARDWIAAGASMTDVLAVADTAKPKSLTITSGVIHG